MPADPTPTLAEVEPGEPRREPGFSDFAQAVPLDTQLAQTRARIEAKRKERETVDAEMEAGLRRRREEGAPLLAAERERLANPRVPPEPRPRTPPPPPPQIPHLPAPVPRRAPEKT